MLGHLFGMGGSQEPEPRDPVLPTLPAGDVVAKGGGSIPPPPPPPPPKED